MVSLGGRKTGAPWVAGTFHRPPDLLQLLKGKLSQKVFISWHTRPRLYSNTTLDLQLQTGIKQCGKVMSRTERFSALFAQTVSKATPAGLSWGLCRYTHTSRTVGPSLLLPATVCGSSAPPSVGENLLLQRLLYLPGENLKLSAGQRRFSFVSGF